MSKLQEYLLRAKEQEEALLIDDEREMKTKDEYIENAEEGLIVAFRLNFEARSGLKLTKVISGKIIENRKEDEIYVVETRNSLRYGVPYSTVSWVKTGTRWPKGVYQEMKKGSVVVTDEFEHELGGLEEVHEIQDLDNE